MDESVSDSVRRSVRERLDALRAEDALVDLFGREPSMSGVMRLAADSEYATRMTFLQWTYSESDGDARQEFALAADETQKHYELIAGQLPAGFEASDDSPLHERLREQEETVVRVASGLVGRHLAAVQLHRRIATFFRERDVPDVAEKLEEIAEEERARVRRADDLLADLCETEDDRATAIEAAERTIREATQGLHGE